MKKYIYYLFVNLIVVFITGCSSTGISRPGYEPFGEKMEGYIKIPILLATDRKINQNKKSHLKEVFLNERGDGKVRYSEVIVSIPNIHKFGTIDKGSIFRKGPTYEMKVWPNPTLLNKDNFYNKLSKNLKDYKNGDIIIFIHGYNNNIDDAVLRTAQISYDLESVSDKNFIPMTYSWASKDDVKKYLADYDIAEWSVPHLKEFLIDVHSNAKNRNINVIVHSMGNKVFTKALDELHRENKNIKLNQVILAAPDIDAKVFMDNIVPSIKSITNRTTIYLSNKDKTMMLSESIRTREPRLGRGDKELKELLLLQRWEKEKINLINASNTDFSLWGLNHSYFAEIESVIFDISNAIKGISIEEREKKDNLIKSEPWWNIH